MLNKLIIPIILIVALIGGGIWYVSGRPDSYLEGYQAVYLTNGRVYFGKLSGLDSDYPLLSDVHYLLIRPAEEVADEELSEGEEVPAELEDTAPEGPGGTLVRLGRGGELHSPKDEMRLNRQQILFVENLEEDSRIVQMITGTE